MSVPTAPIELGCLSELTSAVTAFLSAWGVFITGQVTGLWRVMASMDGGNIPQWVSAVGTVSAVVVALFKDAIYGCLNKPKLTMRVENDDKESPYFHVSKYQYCVGEERKYADCYYFRIRVDNSGKTAAEGVQIFA